VVAVDGVDFGVCGNLFSIHTPTELGAMNLHPSIISCVNLHRVGEEAEEDEEDEEDEANGDEEDDPELEASRKRIEGLQKIFKERLDAAL